MWEPDFEVVPSEANARKVREGSLITEGFVENFLKATEHTPLHEPAMTLVHEVEMLRKGLEWQSKAFTSKEKEWSGKEIKVNATIRDLERRISDLISSDQYQRLRQRVKNTLEEFLAEI